MGEIETRAHTCSGYDSSKELFEAVASRERFRSDRFMEIAMELSTEMSDRAAARCLNRVRHEEVGISPQTYRNVIEREGVRIAAAVEKICDETLLGNGFDIRGEIGEDTEFAPEPVGHMEVEAITEAMERLNIKQSNAGDYETREGSVAISVDDVCVGRQTERRPRGEAEQPKRVNNSVVHVENGAGKYRLNSADVGGALRALLGFLLCGGLLGKQLVFFTDGAREIHGEIARMFAFANWKIVLDWWHLEKKCKEQLSMALKGKVIRNEFLGALLPCLWFGNVGGAVELLANIDPEKVRNPEHIDKLVEYFGRVGGYIPNYALRKQLGLRNSSNLGEKANDVIVSSRQKHNGMSWSDDGSHAFASVAALLSNGELLHWLHHRSLSFRLALPDAA